MRHSKSAQLKTAPTKHRGESVYLFFKFTIVGRFQWTANPLNPPYQGDFGNSASIGVIGKCLLISLLRHSFRLCYHFV